MTFKLYTQHSEVPVVNDEDEDYEEEEYEEELEEDEDTDDEGVKLMRALRQAGVSEVTWKNYEYNDEGQTEDETAVINGISRYLTGYAVGTMSDVLAANLNDYMINCDYGSWVIDVQAGTLNLVADCYMPEPELVVEPLATPVVTHLI